MRAGLDRGEQHKQLEEEQRKRHSALAALPQLAPVTQEDQVAPKPDAEADSADGLAGEEEKEAARYAALAERAEARAAARAAAAVAEKDPDAKRIKAEEGAPGAEAEGGAPEGGAPGADGAMEVDAEGGKEEPAKVRKVAMDVDYKVGAKDTDELTKTGKRLTGKAKVKKVVFAEKVTFAADEEGKESIPEVEAPVAMGKQTKGVFDAIFSGAAGGVEASAVPDEAMADATTADAPAAAAEAEAVATAEAEAEAEEAMDELDMIENLMEAEEAMDELDMIENLMEERADIISGKSGIKAAAAAAKSAAAQEAREEAEADEALAEAAAEAEAEADRVLAEAAAAAEAKVQAVADAKAAVIAAKSAAAAEIAEAAAAKKARGFDLSESVAVSGDGSGRNMEMQRLSSSAATAGKRTGYLDRLSAKWDGSAHWSKKPIDDMQERDWRIFREDMRIATKGNMRHPRGTGQLRPARFWEEAGLPPLLFKAVTTAGYKTPTAIQMMAIPLGLANRDTIGVAKTGSGKTAAYLLPTLAYVEKMPRLTRETASDGPYALVLAPTRELVQQIEDEAVKFAQHLSPPAKVYSIIGGISVEEQGFVMHRGVELLVATPGRLVDALESRYLVLARCMYLVLDEADRMVDLGFEAQLNAILERMPTEGEKPEGEEELEENKTYRQTFMFSATMPPAVEKIARTHLRSPAYVYVGDQGAANEDISQTVIWIKENAKLDRLFDLLEHGPPPPVIVFVNQKHTANVVAKALEKGGYSAATIHGGKSQDQRETALETFKRRQADVLVATDVIGRGIDIQGVEHVIQYDIATSIEQYTHRIGRTGRAGRKGVATTFVTGEGAERDLLFDLKKKLEDCKQPVPSELARHEAAKENPKDAIPGSRPRERGPQYAKY